ncbi:hypothetical protein ACFX58_01770 [Sphingomonas sp. NCPPB 2930]
MNFPVAYLIAKTLQFIWFIVWAPWSFLFTFSKYPNFELSLLSIANSLIFALFANRYCQWRAMDKKGPKRPTQANPG